MASADDLDSPPSTAAAFGAWLRRLREAAGLSGRLLDERTRLAPARVHLSKSEISRVEGGQLPGRDWLRSFLNECGVPTGSQRYRKVEAIWGRLDRDRPKGSGARLGAWPPRSVYLAQVQRIAPPQLPGREDKLAELVSFCLGAGPHSYLWCQAAPWAGKSALLSTLVLKPPAELAGRVWILSFFITARLAGQNSLRAFTAAMWEQLSALLGQEVPAGIPEEIRDARLLTLLAEAAAACRAAGGRLVLVVDGLDEDQQVRSGTSTHSIAAMLPAEPPADMRIIVSGRPHPPLPADVLDWHPLHDPGIIFPLRPSPSAGNLRRSSEEELTRLLRETGLERDILGLVTGARGGLSVRDLQDLTGSGVLHIKDVLHAPVGRTFDRRPAEWTFDPDGEVYLLAHDELQRTAERHFGDVHLTEVRHRLHAWADSYRRGGSGRQSWPDTTPEYLLRGYPGLLHQTGDVDRLAVLATDAKRHNLMLDLTGGDAAGLSEIADAQDLLLRQSRPDLLALARISVHRTDLLSRNAELPVGLPRVWATMGQFTRAEALARSYSNPIWRTRANAEIAQVRCADGDLDAAEASIRAGIGSPDLAEPLADVALAAAARDDHSRAHRLGIEAARLTEDITEPPLRRWATLTQARAHAAIGDGDRARKLIMDAVVDSFGIGDGFERSGALTGVARVAGSIGAFDLAERIVRSIDHEFWQATALADLSRSCAGAGEAASAHRLAADAEQLAASVTPPRYQATNWAELAQAVAVAGERDRSRQLAARAEAIICAETDPKERAWQLAGVAVAFAAAGDHRHARDVAIEAERLARTNADPQQRIRDLTALARSMITIGRRSRARALAMAAKERAHRMPPGYERRSVLVVVALVVALLGQPELISDIVGDDTPADWRSHALNEIARAIAAGDQPDRLRQLATTAERLARPRWSFLDDDVRLTAVAVALAAGDDPVAAERAAAEFAAPGHRESSRTALVVALAIGGRHEDARRLATDVERAVRDHDAGAEQSYGLGSLASAVAAAGDHEWARRLAAEAESMARSVRDPEGRARLLADAAEAMAAAADHEAAARITDHIAYPKEQARALVAVARAVAIAGDRDRAEVIAVGIGEPAEQAAALAAIAEVAGPPAADRLLAHALAVGPWQQSLIALAARKPEVVTELADALGPAPARAT